MGGPVSALLGGAGGWVGVNGRMCHHLLGRHIVEMMVMVNPAVEYVHRLIVLVICAFCGTFVQT